MHRFISSDQGDLFEWDEESRQWLFLRCSGISRIIWPEEQAFACQFCKGVVERDKACSGCGAKKPIVENSLGTARVTFNFFLPSLDLFDPKEYIRAAFASCGQRCDPENWDFKMEFRVLRVCRRYIDSPVAMVPDDNCRLEMFVECECEVTFDAREYEH